MVVLVERGKESQPRKGILGNYIMIYIPRYIHRYIYRYIHVCIHIYIRTYIHTYQSSYTLTGEEKRAIYKAIYHPHTYIHALTHSHTHSFTFSYVQSSLLASSSGSCTTTYYLGPTVFHPSFKKFKTSLGLALTHPHIASRISHPTYYIIHHPSTIIHTALISYNLQRLLPPENLLQITRVANLIPQTFHNLVTQTHQQ